MRIVGQGVTERSSIVHTRRNGAAQSLQTTSKANVSAPEPRSVPRELNWVTLEVIEPVDALTVLRKPSHRKTFHRPSEAEPYISSGNTPVSQSPVPVPEIANLTNGSLSRLHENLAPKTPTTKTPVPLPSGADSVEVAPPITSSSLTTSSLLSSLSSSITVPQTLSSSTTVPAVSSSDPGPPLFVPDMPTSNEMGNEQGGGLNV
ncbi:hypothetical protein D9758_015350 [Tetrapyrgos nigripes]|uniref:Uncharacterized protein n=1 Tax=Tetrapyrgos nigripes TaxID=182062 RepID=A0A8H5FP83_9AGAR|nr:hypothetical protein D9758_015350 [Tetrapyrgos nigripes]